MNSFYKLIWIQILVIIGSIYSCETYTTNDSNKETILDQVVLIIDKCPNYSSHQNKTTGVYSSKDDDFEITAINSDSRKLSYKTKSTPERDTVVFASKGDVLEIDHIYKFHRYVSFRAQRGDTILFTYDQDFPKATVLNRRVSNHEVNYESIRNEFLLEGSDEFDGNTKFNIHPVSSVKGYLSIRDKFRYKEIQSNIYESALAEAKIELEKEIFLLDSLLENGLISKETMSYYMTKSSTLYEFNKYRYNDYIRKNMHGGEASLHKWTIHDSTNLDLTGFGFYSRILDYIEREAYYPQVEYWIEEVSRRYPDYREVYNSIKESEFLSDKDIELLLVKNIKLIIEHFPESDVIEFVKKFTEDVNNPDLVRGILDQYQHAFSSELKEWSKENYSVAIMRDSLMKLDLIDIENKEYGFLDLMAKNKGKLIYVDFWASHCVPCYAAMPYSKALKSKYSDADISFLYISIDEDYVSWVKGMVKAGISEYPNSFMVNEKSLNNILLKTLNINEIPRYLLFNKEGDLIQYRAFGPSTIQIHETIESYVN